MIKNKVIAIIVLLLTIFISILAKPSRLHNINVKLLEFSAQLFDDKYSAINNSKFDSKIFENKSHRINKFSNEKSETKKTIKNKSQTKTISETIEPMESPLIEQKSTDKNNENRINSKKISNEKGKLLQVDEYFHLLLVNEILKTDNSTIPNFLNNVTFWKNNYTHEIFLPSKVFQRKFLNSEFFLDI